MTKYIIVVGLLLISVFTFAQSNKIQNPKQYLEEIRSDEQLTDLDIQNAQLVDQYQTKHNGVTHLFYKQYYEGIPVYNAILNLNITKDNKLLHHNNNFVHDLESKVNTNNTLVQIEDAIALTAQKLGVFKEEKYTLLKSSKTGKLEFAAASFTDGKIEAEKVFFPMEEDVMLAWEIVFAQKGNDDSWSAKIDAVTGSVLEMENRTIYCNHNKGQYHNHTAECREFTVKESTWSEEDLAMMNGTYRVYPVPAESPVHGSHELIVEPHFPSASPFGWHDIDGMEGPEYTITRGNNVHAYDDSNDDFSSSGDEPDGGPDLIFDFAHRTDLSPDSSAAADVVNLFYANNMIHDITHMMGFDESAGNFQFNNYGNGGTDSDFVIAHALDGAGTNNANFSLSTDGNNGNMNMFRWDIPTSKLFSVSSPNELDKKYQHGSAGDGWGFDETYSSYDIEAEIAPAYDDHPQFANNVCGPVANPEEIEGKIAMIYRGRCEFGTKSLNAEAAGAIAVIICNVPGGGNDPSSDGNDPISNGMGAGADGGAVTIPVFALGYDDCNQILLTIEAGTPVIGKIQAEINAGPDQVSAGFDNGIIFHEYGHGISSRLIGGPGQVCLGTDEQMGEGWSDFFSLALTVEEGDQGSDARGIGNYVEGFDETGRGIRRFPYSTDMSINPQTFKDIKATTAPHPLGEVWVDMLWDVFWGYVDKYGFDPDWTNTESGNFRAVQLVLDGMKMTGCSPGFISGREGILRAEEANTGGENKCLIWEAFARRGLGFFADGGSANNRNDGVENFDPLPECLKTLKIYKNLPSLIEVDTEIDVELIVANHKDFTEYDLLVSDEIPEGMSYVDGSSNREASINGNQIMISYDSLSSQQWDTIRYKLLHDNTINSTILTSNTVETNDEISEWQRELIQGQSVIFRINSNTIFPTYSGENCWYVEELDANTEASIRFDNIEVTGIQPVVRVWHRINTEFARNGGFIEISTDGVIWNDVYDLFVRNGYDCPLAYTTFAIPGLKAFSGRTADDEYTDSYIDVSDYIGQTISLRFRFGTNNGGTDNDEPVTTGGGWYIDDLDLIDLVNGESQACITGENDQACTEAITSIFDPQMISDVEETALQENGIAIFPNPAGEFVNVLLNNDIRSNVVLQILDIKGSVVFSDRFQPSGTQMIKTVDTKYLGSGMYIVRLQTENAFYTQKLIIE